jgi:hypothetical protein
MYLIIYSHRKKVIAFTMRATLNTYQLNALSDIDLASLLIKFYKDAISHSKIIFPFLRKVAEIQHLNSYIFNSTKSFF